VISKAILLVEGVGIVGVGGGSVVMFVVFLVVVMVVVPGHKNDYLSRLRAVSILQPKC
jgi:hypothetical protein